MYKDTENGTLFTLDQLKAEYNANKEEIAENSGASSFCEWLHNCTSKNGFLMEV